MDLWNWYSGSCRYIFDKIGFKIALDDLPLGSSFPKEEHLAMSYTKLGLRAQLKQFQRSKSTLSSHFCHLTNIGSTTHLQNLIIIFESRII